MAMVMDQHQSFKYYCRICKKGFGCGRALGGHMRAHGIGDDSGHDDPASRWEGKFSGNPAAGTKRMYALRTNPNRLKSSRICKNCGKEFESWKLFLEHGKCSSEEEEDGESLVSSPDYDDDDDDNIDDDGRGELGWSKGKRSRRVAMEYSNYPSSEEEDLANCLVMLSTARVVVETETEESCASADKDEEEEERQPNYAMWAASEKPKVIGRGMFECKACKKVFNSHQALGGHRASHKKVKGCFAAKLEELDESILMVDEDVITYDDFFIPPAQPLDHDRSPLIKRKQKVHKCFICHRVFSSGQALGGHKRCHWVTSNSSLDDSPNAKLHPVQDHHGPQLQQRPKLNKSEPLDLNLPAPTDEAAGVKKDEVGAPLSLEFPSAAALFLQQWIGIHSNKKSKNNHIQSSMLHTDDEADSNKIKLAKLSDLKDINFGGASTPWLHMGVSSSDNQSNK